MTEIQYKRAGWLAICVGGLTSLMTTVLVVQMAVSIARDDYAGPELNWFSIVESVIGLASIYLLLVLKRLLNERYSYRGADGTIVGLIWVNVIAGVGGYVIVGLLTERVLMLSIFLFFVPLTIAIGILRIRLALRFLEIKDRTNTLITAYAHISMAMGIVYVTVLLSPLSAIVQPVSLVILGMVFLREQDQVEFV